MASRQEEKEQRRREREEAEARERAVAGRQRRLQMVVGGLLALALIGGVIALVMGGLLDSESESGGKGPEAPQANVKLPDPVITNVEEAAKAAGCKLEHPKYEGAGHAEKQFAASDYKTNPPTSGEHFPTWYDDGIYAPGDVPELGQLVHTLEHGRINVQYKPGTPQATIDKLEAFAAEKTGYHLLLYENTTNMDAQVAATAWTHSLKCPTYDDKVIDALRTFYQEYVDKGPE